MKDLHLLRYSSQDNDTLGLLLDWDCEFMCYTLEDEYRTKKVYAETRIPAGRYEIKLRTIGGFHSRYNKKFGDDHYGMLWLQEVPKFEYVLIHIGNDDDDSAGCILVGNSSKENITTDGFIGDSTGAYKRIYRKIAKELLEGERVFINIKDNIL